MWKALGLCVLLVGCGKAEDKEAEYDSLAALKADQDRAGFVLLGRFGESWPATVREERPARNEIEFKRNGAPHKYPGYTGYTLKVVHLESDGGDEIVVVFRSKRKS